MSETWVIISINRIFQLNKYNEETYYYTIMTNNYFQIITLIGIPLYYIALRGQKPNQEKTAG